MLTHKALLRGAVGLVLLLAGSRAGVAEPEELRVFGYFQNYLSHHHYPGDEPTTTFSLQQLNLFVQRQVSPGWSAFVNFEALSSYSSMRHWGGFGLEEAWARYTFGGRHHLKLGLLIPVFNSFNEIKNRMPVFPYIIRPLVYESSFSEFLAIEEYWPGRAYLQLSGWLPLGRLRTEYAIYSGNSPNINSNPDDGQTGVDTTGALLVGGRLGIRGRNWAAGLSATREGVELASIDNSFIQLGTEQAQEQGLRPVPRLTRWRAGLDLSLTGHWYFLESEVIDVRYRGMPSFGPPPIGAERAPQTEVLLEKMHTNLDKRFCYLTLGCRPTDPNTVYASYWQTDEDLLLDGYTSHLRVYSAGVSHQLNDRITLKMQCARVELDVEAVERLRPVFAVPEEEDHGNVYSLAATVFF